MTSAWTRSCAVPREEGPGPADLVEQMFIKILI